MSGAVDFMRLAWRYGEGAEIPPSLFDTPGRVEYLIRLWAIAHELWLAEAAEKGPSAIRPGREK